MGKCAADIYTQHDAAFRGVAAWVVLHAGVHIGNVTVKDAREGAGRLVMFVHVIGSRMVRGSATGGGYDKPSAAAYECAQAERKARIKSGHSQTETESRFWATMALNNGPRWCDALRREGFTVIRVI